MGLWFILIRKIVYGTPKHASTKNFIKKKNPCSRKDNALIYPTKNQIKEKGLYPCGSTCMHACHSLLAK